jgi:peptidoglycan/LPS O-acetylase OafA/YrhL
MGSLRFVLALLVVYFHVRGPSHYGLPLPDGRIAVQMFYVISSFYMALVLNEKYISRETKPLVLHESGFAALAADTRHISFGHYQIRSDR